MKPAPTPLHYVQFNRVSSFLLAVCAVVLSACGGGGGGGSTSVAADTSFRAPLPQLVQDTEPVGPRTSTAGQVYFPTALGDSWDYSYSENGAAKPSVNRSVSASTPAGFTIRTIQTGSAPDFQNYLRTGNGNVTVAPIPTIPLAAQTLIGNLLEYPEPFYPTNGIGVSIRQGNWGTDLDGDGVNESFRFEFRQVFVGFETITLPLGSATAAHFRNTIVFTISPSKLTSQLVTVSATQDDWWALNIGLVRRDNITSNANGGFTTASMQITGGSVGGSTLVLPPPDGVAAKIDIDFSALVYDALRNKYYASIPATVVGNGNKIATIDPRSGSVSYSVLAVGPNPGALAMTADGSALYVGVDGAGDIVKLSLPTMTESGRTSLPAGLGALNLAVSPTDPNVVAVAMKPLLLNPTVVGVALIRNGVLQPTVANSLSDLIVFDPSGQILYGYNNETTEFGLRRIAVQPNGLAELSVVSTPESRFGMSTLSTNATGNVIQGHAVFRGSDLQLLGSVTSVGDGCIPLISSSKLVCLADSASSFVVADSGSFARLANPIFAASAPLNGRPYKITPGPFGQVALSFRPNLNFAASSTSSIWLFNHSSLR